MQACGVFLGVLFDVKPDSLVVLDGYLLSIVNRVVPSPRYVVFAHLIENDAGEPFRWKVICQSGSTDKREGDASPTVQFREC
jgi:hypothetical protein